jgi:serine/threonine-protein phosphatase 5
VRSRLGEKFVELFAEVFCWLPFAHVINNKGFVVHVDGYLVLMGLSFQH